LPHIMMAITTTTTTTTTVFVTCAYFLRPFDPAKCTSFYRKDEEKGFILTAYKAILDLIPKLKRFLPIEDDTDPDYFYKIVNAVRSAYTLCDALTQVHRCKQAVIWRALKPLGVSKTTPSDI